MTINVDSLLVTDGLYYVANGLQYTEKSFEESGVKGDGWEEVVKGEGRIKGPAHR